MSTVRTQVYLTVQQRRRLAEITRRSHKPMAEIIRDALDAYMDGAVPDAELALRSTFGSAPAMTMPSRDAWDRA